MRDNRTLIVTADDFGLSVSVNEAVENAHRQGFLSAASLMVGAKAAGDAVERARGLPSLGVGLHLTLLDGRPVLPPEEIPDLVGLDGRFPSDPFRFGVALYSSQAMQRQANAEIEAQFERFSATGLTMDHINGHKHFHLHPVVSRAIARMAPRFDRPPVRVPLEPFGPSFRANRNRAFGRLAGWLFYYVQTRRIRRELTASSIPSNDYVFGIATRRCEGPDNAPSSYQSENELAALLSPEVKKKMAAQGLRTSSYRAALS